MQVGVLEGMVRFSCLSHEDLDFLRKKLISWDPVLENEQNSVDISFLDNIIQIFRERREELLASLEHFENIKPYLL
jgi:hypothetical protein